MRQRRDNLWGTPGGLTDPRDRKCKSTGFATARREYREETGTRLPRVTTHGSFFSHPGVKIYVASWTGNLSTLGFSTRDGRFDGFVTQHPLPAGADHEHYSWAIPRLDHVLASIKDPRSYWSKTLRRCVSKSLTMAKSYGYI